MVKGISRQVIVVHAPEPKMFEQAIFILKDGAVGGEGVTDEALLKEANSLLEQRSGRQRRKAALMGPLWAAGGAAAMAAVWILTALA